MDTGNCTLCRSPRVAPSAQAHGRRYLECGVCRLVFLDPEQWPSREAEREHYGTHRNDPADPGYRAFLDRLAVPLAARLSPGAEGLDYGSGPGPTLSLMLGERGFRMRIHDPFFAPDPAPLRRDYDFVTCTETAEHFHRPGDEFDRLDSLLRPGGWLGLMTSLVDEGTDLGRWRYARDPTHVSLYRQETMEWIAARYGWTPDFPARGVILFHKPIRPDLTDYRDS